MSRGLTLPLLTAVFAVHFLDRQVLAILITPIKAELGLSDTALGFLSGFAFTVFFSTVGLVIARIADVANRAHIITWSLAAFSVMTAACGLATNFWQLLAARIGVGVGEGGTNPASHALIAELYPLQQRATAMATYSIGPHLGLVLAFGLGGWLSQIVGWRVTFMLAGALGLVLTVVTNFALRDPRESGARRVERTDARNVPSAGAALRAMMVSPTLRNLLAGATLATGAAIGLITWLPAFLARSHGLGPAQIGVFLALVFGVAGGCGTYAGGRIADTAAGSLASRKLHVVAIAHVLLSIVWPFALLADTRTVALAALIVPCALTGFYLGPTLAMVQSTIDPRVRAFSAALLLLVANLFGAGLGPLAVGMLSDALAPQTGTASLRYALLLMPALLLWSALHYLRAARTVAAEIRG